MKKIVFILGLVFLQTVAAAPVRVGIIQDEPFAVIDETGSASGVAVDLWKEIATLQNWDYKFIDLGADTQNGIDAIKSKHVDILVGPVAVSYERLQQVDFSRPFFVGEIGMAVASSRHNFFHFLTTFILDIFSIATLGILFFVVVIAHFICIYERKSGNEDYAGYITGLGHAIWFSLTTLFSGSFIESPKHVVSRMVSILWLLISIILISSITASITSALSLSMNQQLKIRNISHVQNKPFAAVKGRIAADYAEALGARLQFTDSVEDAMALLQQNKVEGVIAYRSILQQLLQRAKYQELHLASTVIGSNELAFMFAKDSPLITPVDLGITQLRNSREIFAICERYLSHDELHCGL